MNIRALEARDSVEILYIHRIHNCTDGWKDGFWATRQICYHTRSSGKLIPVPYSVIKADQEKTRVYRLAKGFEYKDAKYSYRKARLDEL